MKFAAVFQAQLTHRSIYLSAPFPFHKKVLYREKDGFDGESVQYRIIILFSSFHDHGEKK